MRLKSVTIQKFRNFVDPQTINIEADVTCLVGKNESGKTTILQALHRLNPANGKNTKFDLVTEYPRWRLARDRRENPDVDKTVPVSATFEMEQADLDAISAVVGIELPESIRAVAYRTYANQFGVYFQAELKVLIKAAAGASSVDATELVELEKATSLDDAISRAKELAKSLKATEPARGRAVGSFPAAVEKFRFVTTPALVEADIRSTLIGLIPKFFYFSNYSVLPGETDLTELSRKVNSGSALTEGERTVVSLLAHAGVGPEDFLDANYDSRKAELQAASSDLSEEVFKYWKVNTDLAVVFGDDNISVVDPRTNQPVNHRILKIELRDARHGDVETNFSTRSTGFQWFFSFFAAFSEFQHSGDPVTVLLDEPGTSLHGEAQKDFIDYIFKELGASKQTIYTTHSQFMVDPKVYEKLRAVHDRATRANKDQGVAVTHVSLSADRDTILPVESALGYSISQHLFLGSGLHLLVEGSSDFVYLMRMSAYMESNGKTPLSPKLALIPVGGVDNMPAFIALMGQRLGVSALVDGAQTARIVNRAKKAAANNGIAEDKIVSVGELDNALPATADIEDLFTAKDYLLLYNWAFPAQPIAEEDLPETDQPIIKKIVDLRGGSNYDHALPAHALTDHQAEFFAQLDKTSIDRFEKAFERLNKTVE